MIRFVRILKVPVPDQFGVEPAISREIDVLEENAPEDGADGVTGLIGLHGNYGSGAGVSGAEESECENTGEEAGGSSKEMSGAHDHVALVNDVN